MFVKPLIATVAFIALLGGTADAHHGQSDQPSAAATPHAATSNYALRARLQHERLALTISEADCSHMWIGGAW